MKTTLCFLILLTLTSFGCSGDKTPATTEAKSIPGVFTTSPQDEKTIGTSVATVQPASDEIDLTGRVDFDPDKLTQVFPLVSGITRQIFVNQGDVVRKDQALAEVFSPDLASAISDFRKASAQVALTDKALERLRTLSDAKIASQKDVQQAETDAAQAKADYDRTLKNLEVMGGSSTSTSAIYTIKAPIAGVVVSRTAQPGAQVRSDGSQNLFTIGNTSDVWVTLDIYPDQLSRVSVGDRVDVLPSNDSSAHLAAKIVKISSVMDPTTFTAKARCQLENPGNHLLPLMFISAKAFHQLDNGLFVPSKSIFYDGDGKNYLFKKEAPGKYRKVEVHLGRSAADKVEILSGISAGDTVVTDQALFLNEEVSGASK